MKDNLPQIIVREVVFIVICCAGIVASVIVGALVASAVFTVFY